MKSLLETWRIEAGIMDAGRQSKIGILTFHRAESYGAVLQAYALQETLTSMFAGSHVGIVDFQPECFRFESKKRSHVLRQEVYRSFVNQHLRMITANSSSLVDCLQSVASGGLTDLVIGSDQVWNPTLSFGHLRDYLAGYSLPGTLKHAYAASFGVTKMAYSPEETALFHTWLGDFATLGVREESGVDLCKIFGRSDARVVLDPTLLADPSVFNGLGTADKSQGLCGFFLDRTGYHRKIMVSLAKVAGVPRSHIVLLGGKRIWFTRLNHVRFPSVEEFLSYIRSGNYMVTDSFHGVCFSLIFRKRFLAVPSLKFPERFCRIRNLLEMLGLSERIAPLGQEETFGTLLQAPIDYDAVYERLETLRASSRNFLRQALGDRL